MLAAVMRRAPTVHEPVAEGDDSRRKPLSLGWGISPSGVFGEAEPLPREDWDLQLALRHGPRARIGEADSATAEDRGNQLACNGSRRSRDPVLPCARV